MARAPSLSLARRLVAEALGTALLVAVVVGSGIMGERLAAGNDAVALLGNTLATGSALVVLILLFGPVSGAHLNPVVSLSFAISGRFRWAEFAAYVPVQILGAVGGTVIAHLMFGEALLQASTHIRTGMGIWTGEDSGHLCPAHNNPRLPVAACRRSPLCRCSGHHGRLLVYLIDLIRKSGGNNLPVRSPIVLGHSAARRSGLHRRANRRRRCQHDLQPLAMDRK